MSLSEDAYDTHDDDGVHSSNSRQNSSLEGSREGTDESASDKGSSVSGGDTTSNNSSGNSSSSSGPQIAREETRFVTWIRLAVIAVLVAAAVSVSVAMYTSKRNNENDEFEARYHEHAASILAGFQAHLRDGISAMDAVAIAVLAHAPAIYNGTVPRGTEPGNVPLAPQEWPFVALPGFERHATAARKLGHFATFGIAPVVTNDNRRAFEAYANTDTAWIDATLAFEEATMQAQWEFGNFQLNDDGSGKRTVYDDDQEQAGDGNQQRQRQLGLPVTNERGDTRVADQIWEVGRDGDAEDIDIQSPERPDYLPVLQHLPVEGSSNVDAFRDPKLGDSFRHAVDKAELVISKAVFLSDLAVVDADAEFLQVPAADFIYPLIVDQPSATDSQNTAPAVVGTIAATAYWDAYMQYGQLPETADYMHLVLRNGCDQSFTFKVLGGDVLYIGEGDMHQSKYNDMEVSYSLQEFFEARDVRIDNEKNLAGFSGAAFARDYCPYSIHMYPTDKMRESFLTDEPIFYTGLVIAVFLFTTVVFFAYDCIVERRQKVVMRTATRSHAIVSSLFPKNVRNRLLNEASDKGRQRSPFGSSKKHGADQGKLVANSAVLSQKAKLRNFVRGAQAEGTASGSATSSDFADIDGRLRPIADLFPNTTVLFADIAGFTAWSSTREPSQVFVLLESIYSAFDSLADRRKVFKVETIGDSYVAVTGLPDPQPDHATIMAKFAGAALTKFDRVTRELEIELGPDTTELAIRVGMHSGPVTAGVLRGQKSRFQLFGDTVNMASRMESTGVPGRIQCSQQTADLLMEHGKPRWVKLRDDLIDIKGKGATQTFWVETHSSGSRSNGSVASLPMTVVDNVEGDPPSPQRDISHALVSKSGRSMSPSGFSMPPMSSQMHRLVEWNVDLLLTLLKRVVAHEHNTVVKKRAASKVMIMPRRSMQDVEETVITELNPRQEYREEIQLPRFEAAAATKAIDPADVVLGVKVEEQMRDYVTKIATSYHDDNAFHNYEHATHVTMSVNKILSRIVRADDLDITPDSPMHHAAAQMHDYTYGITSDPLTHFACVFAALVHDVDHPGVPNMQLVKEQQEMALVYGNKSVAEQNSLDLAWGLLMDARYCELRKCLFAGIDAKKRFRQLLVNTVMATDIFDPELKSMRNNRWERAFRHSKAVAADSSMLGGSSSSNKAVPTTIVVDPSKTGDGGANLKATIVIEHIIQAADVSHTMQHWHVYQKWNRRLFFEMYTAYKSGRLEKDPSAGWFQGELWFYDNYIIPLAKKLNDCGVFGVSSDEFLNYATINRNEWERKGKDIVEALRVEYDNSTA